MITSKFRLSAPTSALLLAAAALLTGCATGNDLIAAGRNATGIFLHGTIAVALGLYGWRPSGAGGAAPPHEKP